MRIWRLLCCLIAAILFISAEQVFCADITDNETIVFNQAKRVEDSNTFDVLIFPSHVVFDSIDVSWKSDTETSQEIMRLTVEAHVETESPENAGVEALSADYTKNGGETWDRTELEYDSVQDAWTTEVSFASISPAATDSVSTSPGKDVGNDNDTTSDTAGEMKKAGVSDGDDTGRKAPSGSSSSGNASSAPDLKTQKDLFTYSDTPGDDTGKDKSRERIVICFRAEDTLGNVTVELFRQMKPRSENEIHFTPLIKDARAPQREQGPDDYSNTPDRDILGIEAAWLYKNIYLLEKVAGSTAPGIATPPGLNYYITRFIPLDTPPLFCQLGQGIYHYHSVFNPLRELLPGHRGREYPFRLPYDAILMYQFAVVIQYAREQPGFPEVFEEYFNLLQDAGLYDAISGEVPMPNRQIIEEGGVFARHFMDRIYWKIDPEILFGDGSEVGGFRLRFYTGYMNTKNDSNVMRDDRTAYVTILLNHHEFEAGVDKQVAPRNPEIPEREKPDIVRDLQMMLGGQGDNIIY